MVHLLIAGCGSSTTATKASKATKDTSARGVQEITLYCGVAEDVAKPLIRRFEERSKIRVNAKFGDSSELADELRSQGKPEALADVFWSNQPSSLIGLRDEAGDSILMPLPRELITKIPSEFRPENARWIGLSARVIVPVQLSVAGEVPADPLELITSSPPGSFAFSDVADFQYLVKWLASRDSEKTTAWVEKSLIAERKLPSEAALLRAIARGQVRLGFVGHDTLLRYRGAAEFGVGGSRDLQVVPGALEKSLVVLRGAGVIEETDQEANAIAFLDFLVGDLAQQFLAASLGESPVVEVIQDPGAVARETLVSLAKQQQPMWASIAASPNDGGSVSK